jgi:hypothetical protein
MSSNIEVQPEIAAKIAAHARAAGISISEYLRDLIEKTDSLPERDSLSPEQRVGMLREWAASHELDTPLLSDDAISREQIYGECG